MRRLFAVLGLVVLLGGCLAGGPAGLANTAQTETRAPCEVDTVQTVDPVRESVTPSPLPDRPADLTESSVASYAEAYEQAYRRNLGLDRNTMQYEVSVHETAVRTVEDGYLVNVTAVFWYNAAEPSEGTATPTVVHADGPMYTATYFVTTDRLRRTSTLDEHTEAPRKGTILECWAE